MLEEGELKHIKVFHDGKLCRGVDADILGYRSGGIKVTFAHPHEDDVQVTTWCRRRKGRGGYHTYEAIDYNFWILPHYSEPANLAKYFEVL